MGIGRFRSGDSVSDKILNMFNKDSHQLYDESAADFGESDNDYIPTGESVVESTNSAVESANSTTDSTTDTADPPKIDVWVRAFTHVWLNMVWSG